MNYCNSFSNWLSPSGTAIVIAHPLGVKKPSYATEMCSSGSTVNWRFTLKLAK